MFWIRFWAILCGSSTQEHEQKMDSATCDCLDHKQRPDLKSGLTPRSFCCSSCRLLLVLLKAASCWWAAQHTWSHEHLNVTKKHLFQLLINIVENINIFKTVSISTEAAVFRAESEAFCSSFGVRLLCEFHISEHHVDQDYYLSIYIYLYIYRDR